MKSFLTIVILMSLTGCAAIWPEQKEKTAEELILEGMNDFEAKKYPAAIESFQKLIDWYPFSKHALKAQLKTADAHYLSAQYEEALAAYRQFEKLHPGNEAMAHVVYRTGRCWFDRIRSIDRDQTATRNAIVTFEHFLRRFPDNEHADDAMAHIRECRRNLAEHEFYVGRFYFKAKHYKAALSRFLDLQKTYPDVRLKEDLQYFIRECEKEIRNPSDSPSP